MIWRDENNIPYCSSCEETKSEKELKDYHGVCEVCAQAQWEASQEYMARYHTPPKSGLDSYLENKVYL